MPSELEDLGFILGAEFSVWGLDLWPFLWTEILLYTFDLNLGRASKVFALSSGFRLDFCGSIT